MEDVADDPVKRVMTSLLVKANVPLTTEHAVDKSASRKRYFDLLYGDGEVASRDVSIRGMSDRACAGLTVETRTSLFGSILRIFDMSEDDQKAAAGGSNVVAGKCDANQSVAAKNVPAVKTEAAATDKVMEEAKAFVASYSNDSGGTAAATNIPVATNVSTAAAKETEKPAAAKGSTNITKADTPPVSMIAPEIMEAAKENPQISHAPILSTAEIVRTCHLSAGPGDIPPWMDSKEFTMAALHFLSSHVPMISENDDESKRDKTQSLQSWRLVKDTFPVLPLLYAINPEESLERRVYARMKPLIELGKSERKQCPDSMDSDPDFRRKVLNLERAFTSSLPFTSKTSKHPSPEIPLAFQRYMPRRKLCPRVETEGVKEELTLMISGHVMQDSSKQLQRSQSCESIASGK